MSRIKIRNSLLLLLTATIWGVAFVAQSVGMEFVGPFTFNCVRSLLGGIVLIPCIWFLNRLNGQGESRETSEPDYGKQELKTLVLGGIFAESCFAWAVICSNLEYGILQWEKQVLLRHFILLLFRF